MKQRIGALNADEVAARCDAIEGVRVEQRGNKWIVFPADPDKSPVFFKIGVLGHGSQVDNLLRNLRAAGIDLEAEPPRPPKTAPPAPQEVPTVSAPERRTVAAMATRAEVLDVREQIGTLAETVKADSEQSLTWATDAEKRNRELTDEIAEVRQEVRLLRAEVAALRQGGASRPPLPPTRAEIIRGIVLAYFESIPGHKTTPQLVEMNIADDLPDERGKTDVAGACGDLYRAGMLKGVPRKDGAGRERGVYWYEAPAVDTPPGDKSR